MRDGAERSSAGLRININQGNLEMVPSLSNSSRSSMGNESRKRAGGEENICFSAGVEAVHGKLAKELGVGGKIGAMGNLAGPGLAGMLGVGGGGVGGGRTRKRGGDGVRTSFVDRKRDLFVEKP